MTKLEGLKPQRVFKYFEEISAVPRGYENMEGIADYCMDFARKHSLKAVRDSANNVIIYKNAAKGYENSETVILQGHLDIVCQKENGREIDFLTDGLDIYAEGDFVKANGTTLGADNGIAVAMILAILESDEILHPAIEAVFTTDEEIGMLGAASLDMTKLSGKKLINLDAEEDDTLTVSCAGGSDFKIVVPKSCETAIGTEITVIFKGLKGGHSGVEINSGRVNANIIAGRFLNRIKQDVDFELISIDGGDKSNAIPNYCTVKLCAENAEKLIGAVEGYFTVVKEEIASREPDFDFELLSGKQGEHTVLSKALKEKLIFFLVCAPNGVMDMSAEIEGLVETSLNLGILKTEERNVIINFSLRSNKESALLFLEERVKAFSACIPCSMEVSGHYPPWEFNESSELQKLYKQCFTEQFGFEPKVEAIHAGLECGIFSSKIKGCDCIAIGPRLFDVHTVNERLSISSTQQIYKLLLKILEKS